MCLAKIYISDNITNNMNKKIITILFPVLAIIIIAGIVWYAQKPSENTTINTDNTEDNQDQVVDGDNDLLADDEIDTSDWVEYKNEEFDFSVKHPIGYEFKKLANKVIPIRGCLIITNENENIVCKGLGSRIDFQFDADFKGSTSLEGLEFTESKREEFYTEHEAINPGIEYIDKITIYDKIYHQAQYFGGDSAIIKTYFPTKDGLLIYNYNVYPIENDPHTKYHEKLVKTILSTLKLN